MITGTAIGRLTAEPELRFHQDTPVANFTLASDNRDDSTTFIKVTIWGKRAEAAAEHLIKGQRIAATGRLETEKWTSNDGTEQTTLTMAATDTEWLDKPKGDSSPKTVRNAF